MGNVPSDSKMTVLGKENRLFVLEIGALHIIERTKPQPAIRGTFGGVADNCLMLYLNSGRLKFIPIEEVERVRDG